MYPLKSLQLDSKIKFENVVLVRFVLIIYLLNVTSDAKMWLKTVIILTSDIKIRKLNSSMLNQIVSMFVEQHKKIP